MAAKRRRFGRIRKLPSGKYQASFVGPNGKRQNAPDTFVTKTDAAAGSPRSKPTYHGAPGSMTSSAASHSATTPGPGSATTPRSGHATGKPACGTFGST